jgi:hypothetical protein
MSAYSAKDAVTPLNTHTALLPWQLPVFPKTIYLTATEDTMSAL